MAGDSRAPWGGGAPRRKTKVMWHSKYLTFELAQMAVPLQWFAAILKWIERLAMQPAVCPSG